MVEAIFLISLIFIFYSYIGYPLQIIITSKFFPQPVNSRGSQSFKPTVSVVVAARNEEKNIVRRIRNLVDQDYPSELMEIIVVSDGSTDNTNVLVERLILEALQKGENPRIRLATYASPKGKPFALNQGVATANGEIIIFADCRQTFESDAVQHLVANFKDSSVGCVSGELVFVEGWRSEIQTEMGAYWEYEKTIRKAESQSGSVVGATGAIYAIRRQLYQPLPHETLLDDVLTPINIAFQGYRVLFEGSALAIDIVSKDLDQEWRRKVRTLAGNWQLLSLKRGLLNPWRNPLWWRFLAHKLSRLLIPLALVVLLLSGASIEGTFHVVFTYLQIIFYLFALTGFISPSMRKYRLVNLSYFFVVLNCAAVVGFLRWLLGQCATAWCTGTYKQGVDA